MRCVTLGVALFLVACGGGDGTGPGPQQFEGTWVGSYTNTVEPQAFTASLRLTQDGQDVTGSLATSNGRTASLEGTANGGDVLTATLRYTDGCHGTVTTTATLHDELSPDELTGDYTSSDCVGETSGTFRLIRQ
jgi:hypothetical protein